LFVVTDKNKDYILGQEPQNVFPGFFINLESKEELKLSAKHNVQIFCSLLSSVYNTYSWLGSKIFYLGDFLNVLVRAGYDGTHL
jgi:hypothetical protein